MSTPHSLGYDRSVWPSSSSRRRSWLAWLAQPLATCRRFVHRFPHWSLSRQWCLRIAVLLALLWFAVGANQLGHQLRDGWREYRAASAVVLLGVGVLQLLFVRRLAQERRFTGLTSAQLRSLLLWQSVVLSAAFAIGLLLGPAPEARYVVRALFALGWTLSLAAVELPSWRERLDRWDHIPLVHRTAMLLLAWSVAAVTGESLCWTVDRVAGIEPRSRVLVQRAKLAPGTEFRGRQVNQLGYWDDEFRAEVSPHLLRVAVLGHDVPLSGDAQTNCLAQVERHLPGVEMYNFGLRQTGPREFVTQIEADVVRYRPQLVLTFLNLGEDLLLPHEPLRTYDWRSLRMVQWTAHSLHMPLFRTVDPALPGTLPADYEQRLHAEAARLAICRTPLDDAMQQRYQTLTRQLQRLAQVCRQHQVPVALVLVPSEFQVSSVLRTSLMRRAGYEPRQIDLELPQRQLASFAHREQLPVIDLLPYFRSASVSPYALDSGELSDAGSALTVQVLGGWLQSRYGNQLAGTN
ncbi:MAG: hypothetical protein JNM18_05000 [Planctomycetaceae bacterium]|nr:hypothetical protein [Planctomycetaceae bacterium]